MSEKAEQLLEQIAARLSSIETLIVAGISGQVEAEGMPAMSSQAPGETAAQWFCNSCERPLPGDERCGTCFDQRIGRFKK